MEGSPSDLRADLATERARIDALQRELERLRDRFHPIAEAVTVIRYLAEQIEAQGEALDRRTREVAGLGRRALDRPSLSTIAACVSALAACIAVFAALHH